MSRKLATYEINQRGFACVALQEPKFDMNVGGALRAAQVYGANMLVVSGQRFEREATDSMKAYRHLPVLRVDDVFAALPFDCVPVAVDIVMNACPLPRYCHPPRAFYVFGAEDRTLGEKVLSRCRDRIVIPTTHCMNLAATVNVVLYDRMAKRFREQAA